MQLVKPSVFHTFPVVFWLPVYCKICHLLVPSFQLRLCQSFLGIQTDHNLPTSTSSMLTSAGTPRASCLSGIWPRRLQSWAVMAIVLLFCCLKEIFCVLMARLPMALLSKLDRDFIFVPCVFDSTLCGLL